MNKSISLDQLDKSKWESFTFEQIAKKISETVQPSEVDVDIYVGLEHIDRNDIHIKRTGNPSQVKGAKLRCYPGDIIFGKRRAYQRKAAIVDFEGICSAHAFVFRAIPEVIDPQFFPFFLHSDQFMHRMIDISVGGLSPTINWNDLKQQEFLLPPLETQTEIIKLFLSLDYLLEKDLEILKIMENLLYAKTKFFFKDNQNKIKIKELVKHEVYRKAEVGLQPYIEIGDINTFNKKIIYKNKESVKGSIIASQDSVLVSKVRPDRGAVHILKADQIVTNGFSILFADAAKSSSSFLFYCIAWNKDFYYQMSRLSTGSTYPTVEEKTILSYLIPSVDKNLQNDYVKQMDNIYLTFCNFESKTNKTRNLLNAVINKIF
jgi:restriction endonuclease S subunit